MTTNCNLAPKTARYSSCFSYQLILPISKENVSFLLHFPINVPYQSLSLDDLPSHSPIKTEDIRILLIFPSLNPQIYLNLQLFQRKGTSFAVLEVQVFLPGIKFIMFLDFIPISTHNLKVLISGW